MKKVASQFKWIIAAAVILVMAGSGILVALNIPKTDVAAETAYKETTVKKGNLTVGVTESGSVSIGTVEQTFDLTLTGSASLSTTEAVGAASMNANAGSTDAVTASLTVEAVYVAGGQIVKTGDQLLKLTADSVAEARDVLASAVTTAELALKQAKMERDAAQLEADSDYAVNKLLNATAKAEYNASISMLTAAVTNAQTALDEAEAASAGDDEVAALEDKLAQAKREKTTGTITAKAKYDESLLTYENALTLFEIATLGIDDDVEQAEEDLADAQDNLQAFDDYVGDGYILSEYDGTLTAVGYVAGDELSSVTAIATFQDATAVTMSVSVAQDDISLVQVGGAVNIVLTAYDDVAYSGTVSAIATSTTNSRSTTVSYPVTVLLSGDIAAVYAGMTGNVTFITKQVPDVLYVSNKAISTTGSRSTVKLKNSDGTIKTVEVKLGFSDGYQVEIQSGLQEGDTVLIESQVKSE